MPSIRVGAAGMVEIEKVPATGYIACRVGCGCRRYFARDEVRNCAPCEGRGLHPSHPFARCGACHGTGLHGLSAEAVEAAEARVGMRVVA